MTNSFPAFLILRFTSKLRKVTVFYTDVSVTFLSLTAHGDCDMLSENKNCFSELETCWGRIELYMPNPCLKQSMCLRNEHLTLRLMGVCE